MRMLNDSERGQPEWQQRLTDYEKEIADWDVSAEKSERRLLPAKVHGV